MKITGFFFCCLLLYNLCQSQTVTETHPPNYIQTIQFRGDSAKQSGNPVFRLGERIRLSFDDIIGDEADYYYTIEHYNYEWTPSSLAKSEYMEGFDDIRIFNYENSYNTLQPYSRYKLQIPNEDTRALKVTGNYMLRIFNDSRELVFSRKFMIYEAIAKVDVAIRRSRAINFINEKQVVNFSIDSPDLLLKNPKETVKVLVMQNQNLKTAIGNLQPQYTLGNQLIYRYDQETAFWGGNEYIQFDNKDLRATTADISHVELNDLYHHHLYPDRTRAIEPYTYNPDINGEFVIRSMQSQNPDIEAEYVWVHFNLRSYKLKSNAQVHIYGGFNNFVLDNSTRLHYNQESGLYEGARLFKQGFYNYKYVVLNEDGSIDEGVISGNFDETENDYHVLVYYRNLGARYDRIIGIGKGNSVNISN